MALSDFKTQAEALKVADELVLQNKEDHGHDGKMVEHEIPLLNKYTYFASHGKKRTSPQDEKSPWLGTVTSRAKQLRDSGLFQEALGFGGQGPAEGQTGVKLEHVMHNKLQAAKDSLRSPCKKQFAHQ